MCKSACDPKADVSFHLVQKLRDQQPFSQVHFFYRLHRELVAAEYTLALDDGGQNEMAVRFVACSCSRCMRGERKFRPGKATQACDAHATDVRTGDPSPSEAGNSESIPSRCE